MSDREAAQRAIDYIEEHLDGELAVPRIAEEVYLSVAQLYRAFYVMTGHPVKDYIRKRRMSVAAQHLRHSDRSVSELAWDSGFESYPAFAKVFKKITGLTPAAYRKAACYYSFERIRLHERFAYREERELLERFPDVKVIRLHPGKVRTYLHVSEREAGIEEEAFEIAFGKIGGLGAADAHRSKARIFGHNADVPQAHGQARYGYRLLIADGEGGAADAGWAEEEFPGGLYAVRKVAPPQPEKVQEAWNRMVAEWLPGSSFEIGEPPYLEEMFSYNGKVTRMNLYLPVRRKLHHEPIEVVRLAERPAFGWRGYGAGGRRIAERRLIEWFEGGPNGRRDLGGGRYYMVFHYGHEQSEGYWWENGIVALTPDPDANAASFKGLEKRSFSAGLYACCRTRSYGMLTGVLERLYRWIAESGEYRVDDGRQWFAEYVTVPGMDVEQDALATVRIPIREERPR